MSAGAPKRKKFVSIFLLFLLIAVGTFVAVIAANYSLQVDDSSALYGGRPETGYLSAGFLINETTEGGTKTCGYSVITNQVAITAGHCVDDARVIYIGVGAYSSLTDQLKRVDRAIAKRNWAENKARSDDFAILAFNDNDYFSEFAKIGTVSEGCNFRVVAYGRTEDPLESITKPRKSALLCASSIGVDTFRLTADNAGICFGDSGSPVYREGTNEVVGVIASIIKKNETDNEPCSIGNTAIVVRVDTNERIIRENVETIFGQSANLNFPTETVVEVADETLLEQLGLAFLQNADQRTKDTYLLFGVMGLLAVLIISLGYLLYSGREKQEVQVSSMYT